jgi:diguanylate cyclase (GGDEF)-like protein
MVELGRRLLLSVGLVALAAIAVWLWASWQQTRAAQLARMGNTVKLLAAHADHYFASIGVKLEALARDLNAVDPLTRPEQAVPILQAFKAGNPELQGVLLVRANGQALVTGAHADGQSLPNIRNDPQWRTEFAELLKTPGMSLGRPRMPNFFPSWVIPMRYTVRDRRGRVTYLIMTGIPLDRQQALWRNLELKDDAALGLLREDGYLMSRLPDDPSGQIYRKQNLGGALFLATRDQPLAGIYEGAVADGSYRLGVYQRLAQHPMYAFLSHRRPTFVAMWWEQVRWPLLMVAAFLLTALLTYHQLAGRYAGRMRLIEARLARAGNEAAVDLPASGVREIDTLVSALAQSRDKLRQAAHNREKLLLAAAEAGTFAVRERDGRVLAADATLLAMLGRHEAEVVGRPWAELFSPTDQALDADDPSDLARRILRAPMPDGKARWIAVAEYRDNGPDGEAVRHGLAIEVTDRERLLSQVNIQSQRLQALWQLAMTRGKTDSEKMQLMLRLALDALHMDTVLVSEWRGEQVVVREAADDLRVFHAGQEFALDDSLCRLAIESRRSVIIHDLRADSDLYRHRAVVDLGVRGFCSVPIWTGNALYGTMAFLRRAPLDEDFSADDRAFMELLATWFGQILLEERQRRELERLAMTDTLTRLINRRAAEARFGEEFARARRNRETFSIAVCDLDRFKLINDHYGHDTGDQVLLHVAGIMRDALREGDWVARWGGEEFIIFLHGADAGAAHVAMERLRCAIKGNPVSTAHGPLDITTSIGIGTFRGEGELATVLSEADGCLYEAKRAGRDHVVVSESSQRGTLWKAGMLQHALLENRIVPAYQAIVDLRTHEVVADEALARLIEPDGRVVAAGEFIEAAEGINLIHVVDEVMARQAMQRCAAQLCDGANGRTFAHFINLSPQFLARRELVEAMLHQAAQHCVETGMVMEKVKPLVLEITERQLLGNFEDLMGDLKPLLDYGFRLALDDFGSGYSSFLYLASLPVSFLKIEGWMVRHMRDNPKVLGMVKSIIALAREQGITTIAECVEDAATADQLRELGADWAQGWYFGRPQCEVEPQEMLKALRTGTA